MCRATACADRPHREREQADPTPSPACSRSRCRFGISAITYLSSVETPLAAPPRSAGYRAVGPIPIASRAWFKRSQRILGRDWPTAYLFVALMVILLGTIKAYPF